MSLHQLNATTSRPALDHLVAARTAPAGAYGSLPALAGHHLRTPGPAPLRTEALANGNHHVFPLPEDVPALLDGLFTRLEQLFDRSTSLDDELHVAAFATYGVLAVHPFTDANGRTAVDFAQVLLMHRLGLDLPPLALPPTAPTLLAPLFMAHDLESTRPARADVHAFAGRLQARFLTTTLEGLRASPLHTVAMAFEAAFSWPDRSAR